MASQRNPPSRPSPGFVSRVLVVFAIGAAITVLLLLLWYARRIFLLAFAGILLAVVLQTLAEWSSRWTRIPYRWSVAVAVLVLLAIASLMGWLIGARISQQIGELMQALPGSLQQLREQLKDTTWGGWIVNQVPQAGQAISPHDVLSQATGVASSALSFLVGIVVIGFVGLYGAFQPKWYLNGFLHLVPLGGRDRIRQVLEKIGHTLRWWLVGQLVSMMFVGVLATLGLWLLGARLPLALGVLAFFLEIIPNVGPVLAAIPAILLGWTQSPGQALYVLFLYISINAVEGYLLIPLVQMRTIRLPPAINILAVVLMSLLAGILGALVAAPLVITFIVLIRTLYVEDVLGDYSAASGQ